MEHIIKKADILIEALRYIRSFHHKIIVIKYGGAAMTDESVRKNLLLDIIFMNAVGMRPVLVHGGGPFITRKLEELGRKTRFVNGFRVTDAETMTVVEEELMRINRELAKEIGVLGGSALSLSGRDDRLIEATKHAPVDGEDIGFVGSIASVHGDIVRKMLEGRIIPIISPVAAGVDDGHPYNVNADDAAAEIASALGAAKLIFLTNVGGILKDINDPASLISHANFAEVNAMIHAGTVAGGMIPKVSACMKALAAGVGKTHIVDVGIPHALLLEIFTDKGIGTEIVTE
jgi:acetylglutamate kinase